MKAVILAGGMGTRISEETAARPKPMIEIGGRPILWHIMKVYAHHGITDFVICLGYKGYMIKEYFMNFVLHHSDVTIDALVQLLRGLAGKQELRCADLPHARAQIGKVDVAAEFRNLPHGQWSVRRNVLAQIRRLAFTFNRQCLELLNASLSPQRVRRVMDRLQRGIEPGATGKQHRGADDPECLFHGFS